MTKLILAAFLLLSTSVFAYPRIPVNLPACDISNPKVLIIEDVADFTELNNPDKTIFCIKAGNYVVYPRITISGTATEPRYIQHFNPTAHPALMNEADRAVVEGFNFVGADHWVVDHITTRIDRRGNNIKMLPSNGGADHIMINKNLLEGGGGGGLIGTGGSNLTIQDNVIRNSFVTPNLDDMGIGFRGHNIKVIGNEIYNMAGDSIAIGSVIEGVNEGGFGCGGR